MGRISIAVVLFGVMLVPATTALAQTSSSPVTMTTLTPVSITDARGSHDGDAAALATREERGTRDDPSTYVRFHGDGARYDGEVTFSLPPSVDAATITTITMTANFRGPTAGANPWTFSILDPTADEWTPIGDQAHCGEDGGTEQWPCDDLERAPWKSIQDSVIVSGGTTLPSFVSSSGDIVVRLHAAEPGAAKLDQIALEVFSNDGSATAARWTPALGIRWQWQIEGRVGQHAETGGIAVGICLPPFGGGDCVRPEVFDIDLYVDPQIAGRFGWIRETAAVDAIHASGRHVIGYVTQGDAERWRPDYEQFVAFDRACNGCLLGNPFSERFPDEYWANFSGHRRMSFMLQMMRARTDRVAATGFDGIEYDIADTYANGDAPGFDVTAETQLAYNRALTEMAHADGLAVALKNDGGQIPDLVSSYDLAINEQCFQYSECDVYEPFLDAGKPVLEAEYKREPSDFCPNALAMGISAIQKSHNYELFAHPWVPCA
jgi:endo-alpha-1,4-polygalactosaminidase (GH114 family)